MYATTTHALTEQEQAGNDLVMANLGLVGAMIRKLGKHWKQDFQAAGTYDDLFQIGVLALMRASRAETYNPSRPFVTYACTCIAQGILRFVRSNQGVIYVPYWACRSKAVAHKKATRKAVTRARKAKSFKEPAEDFGHGNEPAAQTEPETGYGLLEKAVAGLSAPDRQLLQERMDGLTYREIGERHNGVSRAAAQSQLTRIYARLRERLGSG